MSKQVPWPSKGRIVFYRGDGTLKCAWPAIILEVDPEDPRRVRLAVFNVMLLNEAMHDLGMRIPFPTPRDDFDPYGENKPGCWWWPPREERTMEVE